MFTYDRDWLKDNLPSRKLNKPSPGSVDWAKRDIELASLIENAAKTLTTVRERPRKISRTSLGKEAGCLSLVLVKLDKLPLTQKMLNLYSESSEDFAVRKIEWHAGRMRSENIFYTRSGLIEASGVNYLNGMIRVKNKINEEMDTLSVFIFDKENH